MQESRMINSILRTAAVPLPDPRKNLLGATTDTCAVRTGTALAVGGIRSRFVDSFSPLPADIAFIAAQHAITSYSIPLGGSVPTFLDVFNPMPFFP
jgi:hypothetical protein